MSTFKIGINMPGAISAGAYTAGVLDFLTEALDAWYEARKNGEAVPRHDVMIEVFTGASAGGMCAAISAVLLQDEFEHISDVTRQGTSNRFYESWVNMIDMDQLLKTDDLAASPGEVVSLLDSTVIEKIATYALTRGKPLASPRPYVSPNLTLFLSLTNLRGVPYSLSGFAPDSVEQTALFHGDRIRFDLQSAHSVPRQPVPPHLLDLEAAGTGPEWDLLKISAMATGAFPVFLAPRILRRQQHEYRPPLWESYTSKVQNDPPPIAPTFPSAMPDPFETVNVDGGVTNNDPYNYAHDFLAASAPTLDEGNIPEAAEKVDRAVLTIAPFPTTEQYAVSYDAKANRSIFTALSSLFSALIAQSRFLGEDLSKLMERTSFNNFLIAPSDDELTRDSLAAGKDLADLPPALQCASLGAFGGFFDRGFRAHDYALGRRNCQRFLQTHFILPVANPTMASGVPEEPAQRHAMLQAFACPAPAGQAGTDWLPIIPLCGATVTLPIPSVPRFQIGTERIDHIVGMVGTRFRRVISPLIDLVPSWALRSFLRPGPLFIALFAKAPLTDVLNRQFRASGSGGAAPRAK